MSKLEEYKLEDESEHETIKINDTITLVSDLSSETNLIAQKLRSNVNEFIYMIDQPTVTEDILTDEGIIEIVLNEFCEEEKDNNELLLLPITITEAIKALEKIIKYQKSLKAEN
ncbi:5388_t:CDS:1, partial [Cetraspora pellucida]